jgi:DNA-binding MarR family transcriptional regulator
MGTTDEARALEDPLDNQLGYQLRRAAFATVSALAESFGELGLRLTETTFLRFVHANPGCTQSEVGRALGAKRANLVPIVNDLMANGFIERTPADGRSHALYVTKQGGELHRRINKIVMEHEEYFFGDVPDDTRRVLMQVFRALRRKGEARDEAKAELRRQSK